MYIVELQENCWLAPWDGDPGRTLRIENAERFKSQKKAENALKFARQFRPFKNARVVSEK